MATQSNAAVIPINPVTGVYVSTEFPGRQGDKIVDGSGLAGGLHNNAAGDMWLTSCCGTPDPNPYVVFDLGAVYTVNSFHVWNYNEATGGGLSDRGVDDVVVEYGNTLTFGTAGSGFGSTVAGVTNFAQADETATYSGQNFNAFAPFNARYIKFDVNSQHGPVVDSFGLSEVEFDGTFVSASTEPVEISAVGAVASSNIPLGGWGGEASTIGDPGNVGFGTSGLNVLGHHTTSTSNMWLSSGIGFGGEDLNPEIVYDLGAIVNIGDMQVWNYNELGGANSDRGVDEVVIRVSDDNFGADDRLVGTFNFAEATLLSSQVDFSELFGINMTARYVKLDIVSNHGDSAQFYGLSEVKFFEGVAAPPAAATAPEPSTALLAVLALAGLALGRRRRARSLVVMLAMAACFSATISTANAAPIVGVTIEDFSSELGAPFNRLAVETIDGSGLTGGMHDNNAANMWETKGTLQAPNDTAPWHITYDLGANYSLNDIHVWNYNEAASNLFQLGAKDVEIYIAPTDNVAGLVKLDNAGGDFVFAQANGLNTYTGFSVDTSNVTNSALLDNARLVRFNILTAHTDNNGLTGLSEVRFDGGAPIIGASATAPEPSTALLALLALAGLALGRGRR